MSTPEQKNQAHETLSRALALKRADPALRVTKVEWSWPGDTSSVRLTVQRDSPGTSWQDLPDVEVELGEVRPAPGTSCYDGSVVRAVAQRL